MHKSTCHVCGGTGEAWFNKWVTVTPEERRQGQYDGVKYVKEPCPACTAKQKGD